MARLPATRSYPPGSRPIGRSPVVGVLAAVAWVTLGCGPSACTGVLESPDTRIRKALAAKTQARLDALDGWPEGAAAELSQVRHAEIVTSLDGSRAEVVAVVEAEGKATWRDRSVAISYLGRETFHMRPCDRAGWCSEGDWLKQLRGVLSLLWQRQEAFNSRRPEPFGALVSREYRDRGEDQKGLLARLTRDLHGADAGAGLQRIQSWQIRVERGNAEVGEDYLFEVPGQAPRRLRARYVLSLEGDQWVFTAGL